MLPEAKRARTTAILPSVLWGALMRTALVGAVLSGILQMAVAVSAQPVLASIATDGTPANAESGAAVISGNGRVIAFASKATNLVPGDNNGSLDVFVRDTQTNVTTRVSLASDGTERQGDSGGVLNLRTGAILTGEISLSDDGSIVAFASNAALVADDTNSCTPFAPPLTCRDIYVHDRTTGVTTRVSVATNGMQGDRESDDPHLSADGRFVVFSSTASTLVSGDTPLSGDVFLHDRLTHTTTRISTPRSATQADESSFGGRISADGQVIAFVSASTTLVEPTALPPCPPNSGPFCNRPYVLDRTTGIPEVVPIPGGVSPTPTLPYQVQSVDLSANGRFVFVQLANSLTTELAVFDRLTRRVSRLTSQRGETTYAASGDGRTVVHGLVVSPAGDGGVLDRLTGLQELALPAGLDAPSLTTNGLQFVATGTLSPQTVPSVYLTSLDSDNDGMPDYWELTFGLNPHDPADAGQDPDGDGRTNLEEYRQLGHPTAAFTRYLAEGAANAFFATRLAIFNPNDVTTTVSLRYLGSNGQLASSVLALPARGRETVFLEDATALPDGTVRHVGGGGVGLSIEAFAPDNDFSTVIESDHLVVVDRTMFWDNSGYGSHAETAIESPATTWYLAEGATHGAFDLFYLLQNPNAAEATVTITYLRPVPLPPVQRTYVVAGQSRRTIWVDQEGPELAATDVSAKITSDQPLIVERAMYYSTPSQPFAGGTDGAGLPTSATHWFLAEGATGSFFDLFVLIANPESIDAQANLTYLLPDGTTIVKSHTIPANSRVTINVQDEDGRLQATAVSTIVESTNAVPILVERAMWWPKGNWYEGHLSAGSTTTGTRWALAEGEVSRSSVVQFPLLNNGNADYDTETYILIANTSASAGTATVTLYRSDGAPLSQTVPLPANSRVNVPVSVVFPGVVNELFAAIVDSDGPQIVVERAMYSNANGVIWAAGSSALATKLQ